MKSSSSRRRSKAASRLYRYQNGQVVDSSSGCPVRRNHNRSGLDLKIQTTTTQPPQKKRHSRGGGSHSDHNSLDLHSCDCSVSTLGDHDSYDGGGGGLLPESPVPPLHRWKQTSGNIAEQMDMPPVGPTRSTGCLDDLEDDDTEHSEHEELNDDDDAEFEGFITALRKQQNIEEIHHPPSELEMSESTDILEGLDSSIRTTQLTTVQIIQNLRLEHEEQNRVVDITPKPVIRRDSHNLDSMGTTRTMRSISTTTSSTRRSYGLPPRLPSEETMMSLRPVDTVSNARSNGGISRSSSNRHQELSPKSNTTEGVKTVDTPPSIARRQESLHHRSTSTTDDDDSQSETDDLSVMTPLPELHQRMADRPPALARRFTSPHPPSSSNSKGPLELSALEKIIQTIDNTSVTETAISPVG